MYFWCFKLLNPFKKNWICSLLLQSRPGKSWVNCIVAVLRIYMSLLNAKTMFIVIKFNSEVYHTEKYFTILNFASIWCHRSSHSANFLGQGGGRATNNVPGVGGLSDNHVHCAQLDLGAGAIDVMGGHAVADVECVEKLEAWGLHSLENLQKNYRFRFEVKWVWVHHNLSGKVWWNHAKSNI